MFVALHALFSWLYTGILPNAYNKAYQITSFRIYNKKQKYKTIQEHPSSYFNIIEWLMIFFTQEEQIIAYAC